MLLKNKLDYPAGHSMDSQWFAVDKDGNVAFFDTGQSATMPTQIEWEGNWKDFIKEHTCKISKGLHKLVIQEGLVNDILSKCKVVNVEKLTKVANEDYFYFEGFIVLNDNVEWQDLMFEDALANDDYEFAICVSENQKLYYITSVYDLEEMFKSALKSGKIKSCVFTDLSDPYNLDDNNEGLDMRYLGGYEYLSQEWFNLPYQRISNPENTLNISQLNPATLHKLVRFENISFKDYPSLQPSEFVQCVNYDCNVCDFENGYEKAILSDNKTEALVAVSLHEWLGQLFYQCEICNPGKNEFDLEHFICKTFGEHPKVILLRSIEYTQRVPSKILNICNNLEIDNEDWYLTNCIKCKERKMLNSIETEKSRFANCSKNFEREIEIIKPLLIISLEKESLEHLSSQYKVFKNKNELNSLILINNVEIPIIEIDMDSITDYSELTIYKSLVKKLLDVNRTLYTRPRVKDLNCKI